MPEAPLPPLGPQEALGPCGIVPAMPMATLPPPPVPAPEPAPKIAAAIEAPPEIPAPIIPPPPQARAPRSADEVCRQFITRFSTVDDALWAEVHALNGACARWRDR